MLIAVLFASFCMGWYIKSLLIEKERAAAFSASIKKSSEAQARAYKNSMELESELKELKQKFKNNNVELRDELKNTIYNNCILPDSGLHLLNNAISSPRIRKLNGAMH